jgi:hypothetical protein
MSHVMIQQRQKISDAVVDFPVWDWEVVSSIRIAQRGFSFCRIGQTSVTIAFASASEGRPQTNARWSRACPALAGGAKRCGIVLAQGNRHLYLPENEPPFPHFESRRTAAMIFKVTRAMAPHRQSASWEKRERAESRGKPRGGGRGTFDPLVVHEQEQAP